MKVNLFLGCEGLTLNNFRFCSGVRTCVLDLETIIGQHQFDLIKYLDSTVKIFEGPCNKLNLISNTMYKLYEMQFIDETMYKNISYFYNMHKRCGIILFCEPKG